MQPRLSIGECDKIITAPGSVLEMEERVIGGRTVRTWKNLPPTFRHFLLDCFQRYSSRTFLSSPSADSALEREHHTYAQVLDQSVSLAVWMTSRGLGVGSKIAIGGGNCVGWIIGFVATQLIGGIAVCLNAWLPVTDLVHCLALTKPELVLLDAERLELLLPKASELVSERVGELCCWSSEEGIQQRNAFSHTTNATRTKVENALDGSDITGLGPESDAVIFFTSGTGGAPKAVLSTNRMALTNIFSGLVAPARAALRAGPLIPPLPTPSDPQKTVLLSIPLFHVTGCLSWLMRAFFAGSKVVMMRKWDVKEAVRLIETEKVTVIGGVPAVVSSILQSPDLRKDKSFETVFYGGAAPSKELAREVKTRWPGAGLVQGYGMTETNAYVCSVAGADYVKRPDSTSDCNYWLINRELISISGPPVPVCDIRIVDADTRSDLPVGQLGLLLVKGPQIMKCYYANATASGEALDDEGWLNTGDVGCVDNEGFLFIKDRLKDIIIRGGENIPSSDIENALYANPAILEAAAIGLPHRILGEVVGAVVTLRSGRAADESSIMRDVKTRLERRSWPIMIWVYDGELPRNVAGKIIKKDLKTKAIALWNGKNRSSPVTSKL